MKLHDLFQEPLMPKKHEVGDIHYIGEALPAPSRIVSTVSPTGEASVGESAVPAREDHTHNLDLTILNDFSWSYGEVVCNPSGIVKSTTWRPSRSGTVVAIYATSTTAGTGLIDYKFTLYHAAGSTILLLPQANTYAESTGLTITIAPGDNIYATIEMNGAGTGDAENVMFVVQYR